MICDACGGSGITITKIKYNSNWHGDKQQELEQTCYKCKGSGEINNASRFQEFPNQQQSWDRSRNLNDGIEK